MGAKERALTVFGDRRAEIQCQDLADSRMQFSF